VLVRAFQNPGGSAAAILLEISERQHDLILSNELLAEVTRVLRYPRMQRAYGYDERDVYDFAASLQQRAEIVILDQLLIVQIRDAEDLDVLRTAVAGNADVLCTIDRDFYEWPASGSLAGYGIAVTTDVQLLRAMRS
jgi:putative PIN family toxin of toxin-antitoxin system